MDQITATSRISHQEAEQEGEANYEAFLEMLPTLLKTKHGEWAVLRDRRLLGTLPTLGEAYDFALHRYPDHRFSLEEIREQEPITLVHHFASF